MFCYALEVPASSALAEQGPGRAARQRRQNLPPRQPHIANLLRNPNGLLISHGLDLALCPSLIKSCLQNADLRMYIMKVEQGNMTNDQSKQVKHNGGRGKGAIIS